MWVARRIAGTQASSPRATPCPVRRPRRDTRRLPWRRRQRQTDGSAAGGHVNFFQEHLCRRSTPQPTIPASPDARSREPGPSHDCGGSGPAPSRTGTLQDRASGVRESRVRCASAGIAAAEDGDGNHGVPRKNSHGPFPHILLCAYPRLRLRQASRRTTVNRSAADSALTTHSE
jgi:hypothetical protein